MLIRPHPSHDDDVDRQQFARITWYNLWPVATNQLEHGLDMVIAVIARAAQRDAVATYGLLAGFDASAAHRGRTASD